MQPRWDELVAETPSVELRWSTPAEIADRTFGVVTQPQILDHQTNIPTPNGLFDPEIFGALTDPQLGVTRLSDFAHRGDLGALTSRFGRIDLPAPIDHPLWITRFRAQLQGTTDWSAEELDSLLEMRTQYVDSELRPRELFHAYDTSGAAGVRARLQDRGATSSHVILDSIAVLPLALRPLTRSPLGNPAPGDLNDLYRQVPNTAWRFRRMRELAAPTDLLASQVRKLQVNALRLFDNRHPAADTVHGRGERPLRSLMDLIDEQALSGFEPSDPLDPADERERAKLESVRALEAMGFSCSSKTD